MTMRERLAQAAIKELNRQDDQHRGLQDLNKVVDAILAEMETPTHEIIDACDFIYGSYDDHEDVFVVMIRAIREGK